MTLRPEPDTRDARWFVASDADWWTLALHGPPGFEAYATVWFDDENADPYRSDDQIMATVVELAAQHTTTPGDLIFGLWDGWGELTDAGRVYATVRSNWLRDLWIRPSPPRISAAFDDEVLNGPTIGLAGARDYYLFRGPAAEVGQWGARPYDGDHERTLPPASLTWPADRAWFIAADVDPEWLCVGGSRALIDAVFAHPQLDAEPADYGQPGAMEHARR